MKITQIRNASIVIHMGEKVILVDPMLAPKGAIPSLKYVTRNRRKNPLVELPDVTDEILKTVTHCLITHCQKGHFDHLDRAGAKWLRENKIPVYCSDEDAKFIKAKGLDVHVLYPKKDNSFLDGNVSLVPCLHGKGIVGKFMAHGYGYVIKLPNEPSLYLTGDTILTDEVQACIEQQQPDCIVLPAGGARFDIGGDIIMGMSEALKVGEFATGQIIVNHLESLDHCPTTRKEIKAEVAKRKWANRFLVPADGETLMVENSK